MKFLKNFSKNKKKENPSQVIYSSFKEAQEDCFGYGYEQEILVNVVYEKTKKFHETISIQKPLVLNYVYSRAILAFQSAIKEKELRVLDFGGACGMYYFLAKAFFKNSVNLKWYVVESPAMAKKAKQFENNELRFYNCLNKAEEDIGRIDLLLSSSTLPYVPKPYETLKKFLNSGARFLFLTRLPLLEKNFQNNIITIQKSLLSYNGQGDLPPGFEDSITMYPITFIKKCLMEEYIKAKYQLLLIFEESSCMHSFNGTSIKGYGYFGAIA